MVYRCSKLNKLTTLDHSRSSNASSNYDGGVDNGKTETQPSSSSTSGEPAKCILNNHKMEERKR